jgi:hypothetical protein
MVPVRIRRLQNPHTLTSLNSMLLLRMPRTPTPLPTLLTPRPPSVLFVLNLPIGGMLPLLPLTLYSPNHLVLSPLNLDISDPMIRTPLG